MGRADAPWLPLLLLCSSCCFCIWPQKQILVAADTDPNDGKLESGIFSPFLRDCSFFFSFLFLFQSCWINRWSSSLDVCVCVFCCGSSGWFADSGAVCTEFSVDSVLERGNGCESFRLTESFFIFYLRNLVFAQECS